MIFKNLPEKILAFQILHIGDFIATTPSLALIKKHFPQIHLGLVISPEFYDLAKNHPLIDELFVYKAEARSYRDVWSIAQKIRLKKYPVSISFDSRKWSGLISFLAGQKERVNSNANNFFLPWPKKELYNKFVNIEWPWGEARISRLGRFTAKAFGLPFEPNLRPVLPEPKPAHWAKAENLLNENLAQGPKVIFTITGRTGNRNWPVENFAALGAKFYHELKARIYIVGVPREFAQAEAVKQLAKVPINNLCGQTNLLELLAILKKSDFLVSVDTGTAHLGAVCEIPQVTLFQVSSPSEWAPQNPKGLILAKQGLIEEFGAPLNQAAVSLSELSPELVWQNCLKMFS